MLSEIFYTLCARHSGDSSLTDKLWEEITTNYSSSKRHYHTLHHVEAIINELTPFKASISDWDMLLFSAFYHDVIYNMRSGDNEEKSAELAEKRLQSLAVPAGHSNRCKKQILMTKTHQRTGDHDTDIFTDADLSILGKDPDTYTQYTRQVRKEYWLYPDIIYNTGRKKVLQHFLNMDHIYKTH